MRGIDDEHLPEIGRQLLAGAQEIDDVADGPMLGHGDRVAPHQPAGGLLGIRERFLDRGAVVGIERAQHGALLLLLHVLDEGDRVVGLELAGDFGDLVRLELVEQLLAHPIVHLGEDVAVEQFGESGGERPPVAAVDQLEQIGDVGRVERLDQERARLRRRRPRPAPSPRGQFGLQPVVRVEPRLGRRALPRRAVSSSLSLISLLPVRVSAVGFLGRGASGVDTGLAHRTREA